MKTWHVEAIAVAAVLVVVTIAAGNRPVEWVGALAVLLTFFHAQVGFRFSEAEEKRTIAQVECHRWLQRYFLGKELCWLVYFVWLGAWSALVGVGVFLVYPLWRRLHLRRRGRVVVP